MTIMRRRYKLFGDFHKVSEFLESNYKFGNLNSFLIKQSWEYAHTHPAFNYQLVHRFGLWEENGQLVGLACYEMGLGECFISIDDNHNSLAGEILDYAETELSECNDQGRSLSVWAMDNDGVIRDLLKSKGYERVGQDPIKIFDYKNDFEDIECPQGFKIISLEDENDIKKINDCLWKGFNHGDEPDDDLDCRLQMQSGPNFSKALTTVIKAPNGDYACFAGMWFDEVNKYAYLEPLATVPEYRGLGLGKLALTEGMKKTKALGANYCYGGSNGFYTKAGFEIVGSHERWFKQW